MKKHEREAKKRTRNDRDDDKDAGQRDVLGDYIRLVEYSRVESRLLSDSICFLFCSRCELDEIGNVVGHLENFSRVELLNVSQHSDIVSSHHVDGDSLSTKSTSSSNSVDVIFTVRG